MILDAMHQSKRPACGACGEPADLEMHGYAEDGRNVFLCAFHALQLARKLTEDLCALAGDRHG